MSKTEHHGPHCAGSCEGAAYDSEIRNLKAQIERYEIVLENAVEIRELRDERIAELEAQLNAVAKEQARNPYASTIDAINACGDERMGSYHTLYVVKGRYVGVDVERLGKAG